MPITHSPKGAHRSESCSYQQESLVTVKKDVIELARADWEEINHDDEAYPFDPDWDLYGLLEDNGSLMIFTARVDGSLVGYFSVVKSPSLHSKGKFVLCNDVIYLHKDHRKGRTGIGLFKFVEDCLKEDGYSNLQILYSQKYDISPLLSRLGYRHIESKHEKRLR